MQSDTNDKLTSTMGQPITAPATDGGAAVNEIDALTTRLIELVKTVDGADLRGLADIHTAFGSVSSAADSTLSTAQAGGVASAATAGMQIVEQIVLKEVDDVGASLAKVAQAVEEMRGYINGTTVAASNSEESGSTSTARTRHRVEIPPQTPINEGDLVLVQEFIGEAGGHIESAEAALLQLEEDPTNDDAINSVFRSFHTIKGVAGFLNLVQIGALAHAAENVLDLARKGKLTFDSSVADIILQSVDAMRKLVDLVRVIAQNGGTPGSLDGLESLLERLHACAAGEKAASTTEKPVKAGEPAPGATAAESSAASQAPAKTEKAAAQQASSSQNSDTTIKVSTERLDSLINMVGELVIAQAMVGQDVVKLATQDRRVARNMSHLGKITRELQDLSMSMRMIPIQGVFQKMNRLVRDLARKAGKEIEFIVEGGETELDRNVVDAISDPLVHMVRNAADHGVEMPEDREKSGKPRAGRLSLKAYHLAGNIVIEIKDDGRGLNKKKILKKSIENGIIREGQELTEQEIFMLIFAPGLSTAEKITDVSGRGVGMDVVKRNVEALRGQIDITSVEGKGSTFTIRLPLTLAVIDGLVVKVGDQRYIVPITSIEQSLQPTAEQISTIQNRVEMCMVRESLLPVLRLYQLFGVKPKFEQPTEGLLVIVHNGTSRCCLLVDELLGQQQVVIKSLGSNLGQVKGISGGAILGDGNVSLILDVPGLIASATND